VQLLTPLVLEITCQSAQLQHSFAEAKQKVIRSIHRLLILKLAVLELHQVVHHGIVHLLALHVAQLCFVLDLLILHHAVLSITSSFEIRHGCLLDFSIDSMQLLLLLASLLHDIV